MKNLLYVLIAVFMVSCGSNKYEKTITDYLLKGSDIKEKQNFKIVDLVENGNITVADSILYLTNEFYKDKQLIIRQIELAKKMSEELLKKENISGKVYMLSVDITRMNNSIDSLKNLDPDNLGKYRGRNGDDILAVIVRCKYTLVSPKGRALEETFNFYLSPDGNKCYGKIRVK